MHEYSDRDLTVETSSGSVQGFLDQTVPNWRGVPYGRVEQRFRPPVPTAPTGQISARTWGPICWQLSPVAGWTFSPGFPNPVESEDCLNLNVWSPDPSPDARRPVLVYLHGGGRVYGSGNTEFIRHFAARHGAVIVTANYRIGPWGMLYLGALDEEFKDGANLTTLDQVLLLHWLQDNVAAFGGDPDNVTVFGMSGGASDLVALLGMPAAKGLFHKAALYSGAHEPMSAGEAGQFAAEFLAAAGPIARAAKDLARLPNVGLRAIHRRQLKSGADVLGPSVLRYGPFVDGNVIPQSPLASIEQGLMVDIPLLVSNTAREAGVFDLWNKVDDVYARTLPDADQSVDHDEKIRLLSERNWLEPSRLLLTAAHKGGARVWAQTYDYVPSGSWQNAVGLSVVINGPVHGSDVGSLLFDHEGSVGSDTDRTVAALEQAPLLALARDGNVPWAQWSPEQPITHRIAPPAG